MKGKLFLIIFIIALIAGASEWIYFQQKQDVLGVVTPLGESNAAEPVQSRVMFDEIMRRHYPPNSFFPKSLTSRFTDEIGIEAKAFGVIDRKSGELLLARNLTQKLPIASVTKMMTALVAIEKTDLREEIRVSSAAAAIGEARMGLSAGETVTVEDLLYGLMLPSGNDAAETLAEGIGGREAFITAMNNEAKSLGMYDTFYFNPTGLDGDTQGNTNFSTALDLLGLTNYALQNDTFASIVAASHKDIEYLAGKHKAFHLDNILQLDRSYPGIKGVKPGNTDFAGETLVSYAENDGKQIVVVLLGAQNSRDEAVKIYDYIFPKLGVTVDSG